jgi:imidazolonepropionase-like amidohydrolase
MLARILLLIAALIAAPASAETILVHPGHLITDAAKPIASATTGAAKLRGVEGEIGRIAPGCSADLIAVDGGPLKDVRILEHVDYVMVKGRTAP